MTLKDDFCQFNFMGKPKRISCNQLNVEWPPPETLECFGVEFKRASHSQLTDEQMKDLSCIVRGAAYDMVENNQ